MKHLLITFIAICILPFGQTFAQDTDITPLARQTELKRNEEEISSKAIQSNANKMTSVHIMARLLTNGGEKVKLTWITPPNFRETTFIIQKSVDGERYEDIAEQRAKTSDQKLMYAYVDEEIGSEKQFYRIVDKGNRNLKIAETSIAIAEALGNESTNKSSTTVAVSRVGSSSSARLVVERTEDSNVIRLRGTSEFKGSYISMTHEDSEMGVVCKTEQASDDELLITPGYRLSEGTYTVRIRDNSGTKKYKFSIKADEVYAGTRERN